MNPRNTLTVIDKSCTTTNEQFQMSLKLTKRVSFASSTRCKKRPRRLVVLDDHVSVKKTKKTLRWSTITIHEFGIGVGRSSVPGQGGPSIGLSDEPEFTWTTNVGEMAECVEGVHRFTSQERVHLLESAGVSKGMILRVARETRIINSSRKQTLWEVLNATNEAARPQEQRYEADSPRHACAPSLVSRRMISVNYV